MKKEEAENLEKVMDSFGDEAGLDGRTLPRRDTSEPQSYRNKSEREILAASGERKWSVLGDGSFRACGETTDRIPARAYRVMFDDFNNPVFKALNLQTDDLFRLPDTQTEKVLRSIEKFWQSKKEFVRRGFLFKRGILLTGAPGGGKTTCIQLLTEQLLKLGGIVVLGENPLIASRALEVLRKIEPARPLICILEDLDELVVRFTEAEWLSLLDGENQINNVVYIGTTNYPQKLDRRFVNRPSRFDEIIEIPMPTAVARREYLKQKALPEDFPGTQLDKWVAETDGFSVAHLRELYVSVFCLGRDYDEVILRLKIMQKVKFKEFGVEEIGFGNKKN